MVVFAVDPGSEQSACVLYESTAMHIVYHAVMSNDELLTFIQAEPGFATVPMVVESFESYGMAVGAEVYRTVWWSGRFHQAWRGTAYQLPRRTVKLNLCQSARATDANVRQAILDRFGQTKAMAIGCKKTPGPLYAIKSHEFAALAVALTWADMHIDSEKLDEVIQ